MGIVFSADEMFEIAEELERNGAAFYTSAAEVSSDEGNRAFLLGLAQMEDEHMKIFNEMRQTLAGREEQPTVFDPDNMSASYLQAFADGHVFDLKANPSEFLSEGITVQEILRKAIELEKDSIVFYIGMKEMVPPRLGAERVENIIKEEMRHITVLSDKLSSLQ